MLQRILGIIAARIRIEKAKTIIVNPGQVGYKWSIVKVVAVAQDRRRTGKEGEEGAGSDSMRDEGPEHCAQHRGGQKKAATTGCILRGKETQCFGSRRTINYTKFSKNFEIILTLL